MFSNLNYGHLKAAKLRNDSVLFVSSIDRLIVTLLSIQLTF